MTCRIRTGSMESSPSPAVDSTSVIPAASARGRKALVTSLMKDARQTGLPVELQRAGLDRRQRLQVIEEARHLRRFLEQRRELAVIARVDAVDHALDVAADDRQRISQLMRDVGQQHPPLLLVGLEPVGHRVEGEHQATHRWRAVRLDPHRVVALRNTIRRLHYGADWLGGTPQSPDDHPHDQPRAGSAETRRGSADLALRLTDQRGVARLRHRGERAKTRRPETGSRPAARIARGDPASRDSAQVDRPSACLARQSSQKRYPTP